MKNDWEILTDNRSLWLLQLTRSKCLGTAKPRTAEPLINKHEVLRCFFWLADMAVIISSPWPVVYESQTPSVWEANNTDAVPGILANLHLQYTSCFPPEYTLLFFCYCILVLTVYSTYHWIMVEIEYIAYKCHEKYIRDTNEIPRFSNVYHKHVYLISTCNYVSISNMHNTIMLYA